MNILLTSVGRRSYLVNYFKKELKGDGLVHVMNSSDISPAFVVADRAVVSPLIYDPEYIPFLLNYCKTHTLTEFFSRITSNYRLLKLSGQDIRKIKKIARKESEDFQ